ncbi:ABC transporter ATP-binding protein [Paenibacillus sp. HB172176]|uniref:ABC transporter ATP-binding protein n=1 Tax=Paenibacillus sp. HB172176 TaxID=2493690 RepID=UPI001F1049FF|nr:ABC transporter ATP-binding protein [Paenibacillus sp. HB172176]
MGEIIRLRSLMKSYRLQGRGVPIIDVEDWTFDEGRQAAIIGPSGSGKSTLLHLLGGVIAADDGEIEVAGQPVRGMKERERDAFRARNIGYVFQDFYLIPSLTVKQNIELALTRRMTKGERNALLREWFARVGLADRMNQLPSQLSRGQQQRVAIIRALINEPKLVLADEPTGSLDWETASSIMNLLIQVCAEKRSTLVAVTHDLHLAELFESIIHIGDINRCLASSRSREHSDFFASLRGAEA